MIEKTALKIVLEKHPRAGRRFAWWLVIVMTSVAAAALSAIPTAPTGIVAGNWHNRSDLGAKITPAR